MIMTGVNFYKAMVLIAFTCIPGCGNDDGMDQTPLTTLELLSSGIWYLESSTEKPLDECDEQTSYHFLDNGSMLITLYVRDAMDSCNTSAALSFGNELQGEDEMLISTEDRPMTVTIDFISEDRLVMTLGPETNVFDRIKG
jgi:hypothetical protein